MACGISKLALYFITKVPTNNRREYNLGLKLWFACKLGADCCIGCYRSTYPTDSPVAFNQTAHWASWKKLVHFAFKRSSVYSANIDLTLTRTWRFTRCEPIKLNRWPICSVLSFHIQFGSTWIICKFQETFVRISKPRNCPDDLQWSRLSCNGSWLQLTGLNERSQSEGINFACDQNEYWSLTENCSSVCGPPVVQCARVSLAVRPWFLE